MIESQNQKPVTNKGKIIQVIGAVVDAEFLDDFFF